MNNSPETPVLFRGSAPSTIWEHLCFPGVLLSGQLSNCLSSSRGWYGRNLAGVSKMMPKYASSAHENSLHILRRVDVGLFNESETVSRRFDSCMHTSGSHTPHTHHPYISLRSGHLVTFGTKSVHVGKRRSTQQRYHQGSFLSTAVLFFPIVVAQVHPAHLAGWWFLW